MDDPPRIAAQERVLALSDTLSTGTRWWTASQADAPLVLVLPALGTPAAAYERLGAALAAAGLHAGCIDLRGIGTSSVRAGRDADWGYSELVLDELPALLAHGRARHPLAAVLWLGHSLGGHLALLRAATFPADAVVGVALVATGSPHWRAYRGRVALAVMVLGYLMPALTAALGWYPGRTLGFGGNQPRTLMREWARFVRRGVLVPRSERLPALHHALPHLDLPLFPLVIEGDAYATRESMRALLSGLATIPPPHAAAAEPGAPTLDHFSWLRRPDSIVRELAGFARQVVAARTDALPSHTR